MKTQDALDELKQKIKEKINDRECPQIVRHLREAGVFPTEVKDCDDNGNWYFRTDYIRVTEEGALLEAQNDMLDDKEDCEEFFLDSDLTQYVVVYLKELAKEIVEC